MKRKKSERQKTDTKASLIKTKNIIKEIIIFLLLTLAIILVLGVVLYQYVPTNKIIPETVSYTTPEKVKAELQTDENVDTSEVVVTYQIDSTDLSNYKRINEYVSGRKKSICINWYSKYYRWNNRYIKFRQYFISWKF